MNKNSFKNILIVVVVAAIFFVVINLFIALLPWLIIGGLLIWIIKSITKKVKKSKYENKETFNEEAEQYYDSDNIDITEAIDVDYKEIDK